MAVSLLLACCSRTATKVQEIDLYTFVGDNG